MHGEVKRTGRSGQLTKFEPKKTRAKVAVYKEGIKRAARIKDWEMLQEAVDAIITEQREFLAWWQTYVTPGRDAGGVKHLVAKTGQGSIPVPEATTQTGITKQQVSKWKRHLEDENVYRQELRESAYLPMWARREGSQLNQQSLSDEHYTPEQYLSAARAVLGDIDLDPASNATANRIVKAATYFTARNSGLTKEWCGKVWLNPPYGDLVGKFVGKFVEERKADRITAGIILVNAHCTDTAWFQPLFDGAMCFTDHRINFYGDDDRSGSTHGSVFVYFGDDRAAFVREFRQFGSVMVRA